MARKKERNPLCRKYARRSGFTAVGRRWSRDSRGRIIIINRKRTNLP